MSTGTHHSAASAGVADYVTARIGDQLFGLPIGRVQDVFVVERVTRVPLAPPEVVGVLNLRGRIVTAIDMRIRLGLPPRPSSGRTIAIGVVVDGEAYGLIVDSVGEVLTVEAASRERNPIHLDARLARVADGVHQLASELLVVLDVERVLELEVSAAAA